MFEDLVACRKCGCTDVHACEDPRTGLPCHWEEADLLLGVRAMKGIEVDTERIYLTRQARLRDHAAESPECPGPLARSPTAMAAT